MYGRIQKYGTDPEMDKLVDSDNWNDNFIAAVEGYGLEYLFDHDDYEVRAEVARHGYRLDKLVNDKNLHVRYNVAVEGYGLDKLINDEHWQVRAAVARQGYGLDILIKDENIDVRNRVKEYLKDHDITLEQWKEQNGVLTDKSKEMLSDFIYKIDDSSKLTVQSDYDSIEEFFNMYIDTPIYMSIIAVDTKETIAQIERSNKGCKFIVDLTNEDGETFNIKTIIKSKDNLNKSIEQTIEALNAYPQFSKYADDLELAIN